MSQKKKRPNRPVVEVAVMKISIKALITWSNPLIFASSIAATKGEAAAVVRELDTKANLGVSYGTTIPRRKMDSMKIEKIRTKVKRTAPAMAVLGFFLSVIGTPTNSVPPNA